MFDWFKKKQAGEKVVFKIVGMHCSSCALNIAATLEESPGINQANCSYAQAIVNILYEPTAINKKQIIEIVRVLGYQLKEIES